VRRSPHVLTVAPPKKSARTSQKSELILSQTCLPVGREKRKNFKQNLNAPAGTLESARNCFCICKQELI